MRRSVSYALLLAIILGWVIPARAYTLQFTDATASIQLKWPGAQITIALSTSLNSPPSNIKAGSDVVGAAQRALAHWSQASNIQFNVTSSNAQSVATDNVSLITVANTPENAALFNNNRAGFTRVTYNPASGAISEADITLNPSYQFSTDGTTGTYDLESAFTHEIGHLLGLDHSGVLSATMQPRLGTNGLYNVPAITARTLSEDDKAGVRSIYGPLSGTGTIEGKFLVASNGGPATPLHGAHIWAENAATGRVISGNVTLADGTFRLKSLPPAQYRVIAEYLNGPVQAGEIGTTSGPYGNLGAQQVPFRTVELSASLNVLADITTPLNSIVNTSGAPFLNPKLLGTSGSISSIAVPLSAGNTYTIFVGGEGVDQVAGNGISVTSPFINVNPASLTQQTGLGTAYPVISFDVSVSGSAPNGDYSIRLASNTGEIAYISGGLTIDNGTTDTNPIDDPAFFITQLYRDSLNREPDASGLAYWTTQLTQCGNNAQCIHNRRISISAAFFTEQEFQQTGYFVYRFYKAAFGRRPTFAEFQPDRARVVGGPDLETNKQNFANDFVSRPAFLAQFPATLTPAQYVSALDTSKGSSLTQAERDNLAAGLATGAETRATVLRKIADNQIFQQREFNPAFVIMQYFGYLRRDPEDAGLNFWLNVLDNRETNNYRGMVCSFITSAEYQKRFSPVVTRSNADCAQ
ncbi:MAG: DUF4214 domain-containing protein [Pyrinomonadaceae bacterium]